MIHISVRGLHPRKRPREFGSGNHCVSQAHRPVLRVQDAAQDFEDQVRTRPSYLLEHSLDSSYLQTDDGRNCGNIGTALTATVLAWNTKSSFQQTNYSVFLLCTSTIKLRSFSLPLQSSLLCNKVFMTPKWILRATAFSRK